MRLARVWPFSLPITTSALLPLSSDEAVIVLYVRRSSNARDVDGGCPHELRSYSAWDIVKTLSWDPKGNKTSDNSYWFCNSRIVRRHAMRIREDTSNFRDAFLRQRYGHLAHSSIRKHDSLWSNYTRSRYMFLHTK